MTEKQLRALGKTALLELLRDQEQEIQRLRGENLELIKRLKDRTVETQNVGSIAEAALRLSGIFQAAQASADIYLENIRRMETRAGQGAGVPAPTYSWARGGETNAPAPAVPKEVSAPVFSWMRESNSAPQEETRGTTPQ